MPSFDNSDKVLEFYSTDESIFKIKPKFVSIPETIDEISEVLKFASQNSLSVTTVGSKTSVAGQGLGDGIILNTSKNFNKIISQNENQVVIEPGVILDNLNESLSKENKIFPPDPASSKWCSIGGMIANNTSGARAIRYGMTKDYVESLKIVLSDGSIWDTAFPQKTSSELQEKILKELPKIISRNEKLIRSKIPNSAKTSCGYDLIGCLENPEKMFTRIFVGSEGTLGIVSEATLKIVEKPKVDTAILFYFDDLEKMAQSVKLLRKFETISAAELLDKTFLDFVESQGKLNLPNFSDKTQALLIVEVTSSSKQKLDFEVQTITEKIAKTKLSYFSEVAKNDEEKARIWALRKSASPLLKERTDSLKSVRVIEDTAVNPELLPKYLLGLRKIFAELEVTAVVFGHAGDGNVHINPLLDPTKSDFRELLLNLADKVYAWVLECGGTISGEHGDGILRSGYVKLQFGELFPIFEEVKNLFDPKGILNFGKILGKETALKNVEFKF
ncbi:MAG: FAD-binding oxidoreductase [Calditrichaeota bacterium]|nr:MAG: FAD-binding oxidoreductase [Calditrichota bacterium]